MHYTRMFCVFADDIVTFSPKNVYMYIAVSLKVSHYPIIDYFTFLCFVTWSLNGSEAGGDLALIQTSAFVM